MNLDKDKIQTFLYFGFLPDQDVELPESLQQWFKGELYDESLKTLSYNELIAKGAHALKRSFEEEVRGLEEERHVVPLSGGLDSRAILVHLLELLNPSQIQAVTFGLPGSPDVEQAKAIAGKTGVNWEFIDLSEGKYEWNKEMLCETAKLSERPTRIFDTAVNYEIQKRFGKDFIYWSGLMGDSLSRLTSKAYEVKDWGVASRLFLEKNSRSNKYRIVCDDFDSYKYINSKPFYYSETLDYYSQLNFIYRQLCFNKHIFAAKGNLMKFPFLNHKWISFILSVDKKYRVKQSLYYDILLSKGTAIFNRYNSKVRDDKYGKLFGKMKNKIKEKLISGNGQSKNKNYIDWNYALRKQKDFNSTVHSLLIDLRDREVIDWFDIDDLWNTHQRGEDNLFNEILTVAALEVNLKSKPEFFKLPTTDMKHVE